MDRRHRLKEKLHGKDIRTEQQEIDKKISEETEARKKQELERLSKEHDQQVKEILTNTDLVLQR